MGEKKRKEGGRERERENSTTPKKRGEKDLIPEKKTEQILKLLIHWTRIPFYSFCFLFHLLSPIFSLFFFLLSFSSSSFPFTSLFSSLFLLFQFFLPGMNERKARSNKPHITEPVTHPPSQT